MPGPADDGVTPNPAVRVPSFENIKGRLELPGKRMGERESSAPIIAALIIAHASLQGNMSFDANFMQS